MSEINEDIADTSDISNEPDKSKINPEQAQTENETEEMKSEETEIETETEDIDSEENEDSDKKKESKHFFKKKEKKDKKDEKIDELNDRLIRLMAEFDNYRKRTEKEKSQMFELGVKDIVEKILPVVDNFERGLMLVTEEEKESAFVQGFDKIYKQFIDSLESVGVKAIEAVGKEFDPNLHNAVMHTEDEEQGENIVAEEFQKGYMYRESVVRHSMVRVVN